MTGPALVVAPMSGDDLAAVQRIEQQSPSPWSIGQLEGAFFSADCLALVCLPAGDSTDPCGFLLARTVVDEAELLKLATDRDHRRQGVAALLLSSLIVLLNERQVRTCHLELRSANLAARRLYEKFDFVVTGSRKNYYTAPADDAICMSLDLGPANGRVS